MRWMDEWIAEQSERVQNENKAREKDRERKEDISQQSAQLWSGVKHWLKAAIQKINETSLLHDRVGSELVYEETSDNTFVVKASAYPLRVLTASRNGLYFKVNRKLIEIEGTRAPGEDENLTLDLDEVAILFVRTQQGSVLQDDEAVVKYLLRWFLV